MLVAVMFLVIVTAAIFGGILLYSRHINSAWISAADDLGLRYKGGGLISGPKIHGVIETVPVEVTAVPDMSNGFTLTQVTVTYPSLGTEFHLEKASGAGRSSSDEIEFHDRFSVVTDAPDDLDALLSPPHRTALLELLDSYPSLVMTDTSLSVVTTGTVANPEQIVTMVRDLVAVARALGDD